MNEALRCQVQALIDGNASLRNWLANVEIMPVLPAFSSSLNSKTAILSSRLKKLLNN
jgi:hypothetical protein